MEDALFIYFRVKLSQLNHNNFIFFTFYLETSNCKIFFDFALHLQQELPSTSTFFGDWLRAQIIFSKLVPEINIFFNCLWLQFPMQQGGTAIYIIR